MTSIYVITDACCACGSCAPFCEQNGIDYDYEAGRYRIDAQRCTGCGTCLEYCPIDGAIVENSR